jgi:aspartyl-tRNA(Asn)/glutamyl-tRNA(Gln) amidotransferase subunit A
VTPADFAFLPLAEAARLLRAREVSAREAAEACLARVQADGGAHGAWVEVLAERALARADALDRGPVVGPLHGVPFAVKDFFEIEGVRCTCGSARDLPAAGRAGATTAPAVRALEEGGAVLLGTLNLHEWAFGATSTNPHHGAVRNPRDPARVPGGSSGGSAVAPALGMAFLALGTDTGGSVRLPASWCGVAGLKVTPGAISAEGCFPLSWSLDSVGPLARTVADLAAAWDVLAATGTGPAIARDPAAPTGWEGTRVGVIRGDLDPPGGLDAGVRRAVEAAIAAIEGAGARIVEIDLPGLDGVKAAQLTITLAEAATVHSGARQAERARYGDDVRHLLALGDLVVARDYLAAQRFRRTFVRDVVRAFDAVDVILSPTTPDRAEPIGAATVRWPDGSEQPVLEACIRYLLRWNLGGAPALSLPCGLEDGLPVGLQLAARPGGERLLLALGSEAEQRFGWAYPVAR